MKSRPDRPTLRGMKVPRTVEWIPRSKRGLVPGFVRMIDQTQLPCKLVYLNTANIDEVWTAIRLLQVRGAPAIGIAAAMGVVGGGPERADKRQAGVSQAGA